MSFLSLHPFLLGIDFTKHSVPVFSFPHPSSPVFFLSATIHLFFVFSGLEVDRTVAYEHFKQRLRVRLSWRRALREMVVRICIAVRAISSHRFTVHESFPLLLYIPLHLFPFYNSILSFLTICTFSPLIPSRYFFLLPYVIRT